MAIALNLIGRTGARSAEVGFTDDRPGIAREDADWWACAQYRGARLQVEHHRGPVEALEALVRRILSDSECARCGRKVGPGPEQCFWSFGSSGSWRGDCERK